MHMNPLWSLAASRQFSITVRVRCLCALVVILLLATPVAYAQDAMAERRDQFGSTLARGDFNGDGYEDLAIGIPWESVTNTPFAPISAAGAVEVISIATQTGTLTPVAGDAMEASGSDRALREGSLPGDIIVCNETSCPPYVSQTVGTYGPTVVSTVNATINYANFPLGSFQAGTTLRIGTCGMVETAFTRNTLLRLFIAGTTTEVAFNDDSCAGRGSQINYVVPYDVALELHAGCDRDSVGCGGTIAMVARLDATPRLASVKRAFRRALNQGVLGISPDIDTLIRGINYQNAGWGEKYHHQGIARTYTRVVYDIAWTTSIRKDGGPEFNNVFFTRMGTKTSTLAERFGSNVFDIVVNGNYYGSPLDAVIVGSNAGVYDGFDPDDPADWDGVPAARKLDHAGGIQAIGSYIATASEFVSLPCTPDPLFPHDCPAHGDRNIPPSGQSSQVVLYNIALPSPQPSLLISRKGQGSGWVAMAKLGASAAPPVLRNGYLVMVPDGNRLSLYAIPADPCTGYFRWRR